MLVLANQFNAKNLYAALLERLYQRHIAQLPQKPLDFILIFPEMAALFDNGPLSWCCGGQDQFMGESVKVSSFTMWSLHSAVREAGSMMEIRDDNFLNTQAVRLK